VAAALALASRLHDIYYGGTGVFEEGSPWYQVYVDYATQNGIISDGQFTDYTAAITRAQFAQVMVKALPEEALPAINNIEFGALPDVPAAADYADAVYTLYNAGILVGNDDYGTYTPNSPIKRSAVATIMIRMADQSQRESFVPATTIPVTSVELVGSPWTLYVGTPFTYSANVLPANATNKAVTWTSSDPSVATVSASGTVTPLKSGTVVITVISANGKTSSRQITVKHTGSDTFNYLVSLTKSKGTMYSDLYLYEYYSKYYFSEKTTREYYISYWPSDNKISINMTSRKDSESRTTSIYISGSLSTPYLVGATYYYRFSKGNSTSKNMSADLYPSTYSSSTILRNRLSSDLSASPTEMETESSAITYQALKMLEDRILQPAGYSLKDLGFDNF
jgi:hypothetical protein